MKKKIYFLSTGRAGTSYIYNFFNSVYPELNITHQRSGSRFINIISNIPIFKEKEKLYKIIFLMLKQKNLPNSTVDPLLSMSLFYLLKTGLANNKNVKIVHLVRDPRDFVTSFMNWKSSSLKRQILHYLVPYWQPFPRIKINTIFKKHEKFDKVKQFIYIWNYKNALLYNEFSHLKNYKLLRLEDISNSDKKKNFEELFTFLDLPIKEMDIENLTKKKINKSIKNKFPKFADWKIEHKLFLEKTCGELMKKFDYNLN